MALTLLLGCVGLVKSVALINGVEVMKLSAQEHGGGLAVLLDVADAVRYYEHRAVAALLEKFVLAPGAEAVVPHGHDLVD